MLEFLSKFEFLNKIFKLGETRHAARERLRLVLIHDRASVSPQMMESLKEDLIAIISKYLEIDVSALEIGLEKRDGSIALAANIPIKRVRRGKKAEASETPESGSEEEGPSGAPEAEPDKVSSQEDADRAEDDRAEDGQVTECMEKSRSLRKKRAKSRSKRKSKVRRP